MYCIIYLHTVIVRATFILSLVYNALPITNADFLKRLKNSFVDTTCIMMFVVGSTCIMFNLYCVTRMKKVINLRIMTLKQPKSNWFRPAAWIFRYILLLLLQFFRHFSHQDSSIVISLGVHHVEEVKVLIDICRFRIVEHN